MDKNKAAEVEIDETELDQVSGGGNVTGGVCKYCGGTDIDCALVQIKGENGYILRPTYSSNTPACPTNKAWSPHYHKDPIH